MDWKKYEGWLILGLISIIFVILLLIMGTGNLVHGDEQLFLLLNPSFNPANPTIFDYFFVYFSTWGPAGFGLGTYGFIVFGLALFFLSLKISALRPMRVIFLLVIVGLIVGYFGITTILKHLITRTRPFVTLTSNANDWVPFFYGTTPAELFDLGLESFPSGHATAAFIFATPFILIYNKYWIQIGAAVFGVLGAYARVYLGVHYPIDVFVGFLIGTLTVWFLFILFKRYLLPNAPWFQYKEVEDLIAETEIEEIEEEVV
mgnify:CR=1 FL=1